MIPDLTLEDVRQAAVRLRGHAVRTPLIENAEINALVGGRVLLKAETLQHCGAFKFRGAYNRLVQLSQAERKAGVVAFSSGNHAQGVARAAALVGCPAVIVMPADAPKVKLEATRRLGATVRTYDRRREDREQICREMADLTGAIVVPSFDDPHIISGQGTAALEIVEDLAALGATADQLLCPVSGGGLLAGIGLVMRELCPQTGLYAVEPEGFDDTRRSVLENDQRPNAPEARSLCDALLSPAPGKLTGAILRTCLTGGVSVTDAEVCDAIRLAAGSLGLIAEPGGVSALAALLSGKVDGRGRTSVIMLTGRNIDPDMLSEILNNGNPVP